MKRLTPYLYVGTPDEVDGKRGWLYEADPQSAAAAVLDHTPIIVPSHRHADLVLEALGVSWSMLHRPVDT